MRNGEKLPKLGGEELPQITVMGLLLAMRLVMVKDLKQNLKLKRHIAQITSVASLTIVFSPGTIFLCI